MLLWALETLLFEQESAAGGSCIEGLHACISLEDASKVSEPLGPEGNFGLGPSERTACNLLCIVFEGTILDKTIITQNLSSTKKFTCCENWGGMQ